MIDITLVYLGKFFVVRSSSFAKGGRNVESFAVPAISDSRKYILKIHEHA